ncbi:glycosyl transferase group 1 [Pseudonocardia dioxanivorans CB1190]|uniref:Glycosyl transferase group 1 n=1 Tax=Pseudonocardia dioxanivorans (strain ATCC 55486 / DSM 44775 / JCM 13855 / CB1190) TaxID=675635 RepID=F4CSP3_PSEUX|nr:glycosyltransferase family 4 protein [Pseudonocardia dioxanivorans]AEA24115.1 glycosyl transferase group 1 [Pseudonocardia dioxanivorans CB1190]GJF07449.1 glycosyl transferase family 1 [Pseudonocardia sp. D17]
MSAQETGAAPEAGVGPTGHRLKVLLVGKSYPDRGGIPTFLEMLRGGALAERHDVRLLNVAHSGVREGGRFTTGNIGRTISDALAVRRNARRADVVHIHSALAPAVTVIRAGLLALAGRSRGCSVVVHAHGGNIQTWLTTPVRRMIMRLAMAPAHSVVAVWTAGEDALRAVLPAGKVRLVDNGVPLENVPEPEAPHDPPRILYVGLLTPRKGVLDLVEASRILRERGAEHELRLLGGAPDEGPEAETAVRDNLPPWVTLLGTRDPADMPAEYAAADVFSLPSWWEAMPLSVLEAMAGGLPVVATDVGDVARAVDDGVTGRVVPVQDPQRLADALEPLVRDVAARRAMGAAGRRRVEERFAADVTARNLDRLYQELDHRKR